MSTGQHHTLGDASAAPAGRALTTPSGLAAKQPDGSVSDRRKPVSRASAMLAPAVPSQHRRTRRLPNQPSVTSATQEGNEDMLKQRVAPQHITSETVLLTFKEAMDFLRVSRSTLYRLMWSGQLRGHKVGSTWRFYESDLLAAVANPSDEPASGDGLLTREGLE